ncbi:MAG TPA: hypothetical protein VMW36_01110 [Patescibacteria group bacterium]|nr:hypothetical protein [Patescibacteria group bacterium]
MNPNLRDMAIQKAEQSSGKFKVSAIGLDKNGNVVARAFNRARFSRYGGGVHAEIMALRKGGNRIVTMIICRVGKGGDILPIDPCESCKKVLDKKGIKIMTVKEI